MSPRTTRAAITMAVLAVLIVGGGVWAWSALTSPFPEAGFGGSDDGDGVCTFRDVAAGTELTPPGVTVNVVNAGERGGAARQTMRRLARAGFDEGSADDAPDDAEVGRVQIWSDDPDDPAVQLVASWLGDNVRIEDRETGTDGVYVVIGDNFGSLREGETAVPVSEDTTVCGPATA